MGTRETNGVDMYITLEFVVTTILFGVIYIYITYNQLLNFWLLWNCSSPKKLKIKTKLYNPLCL